MRKYLDIQLEGSRFHSPNLRNIEHFTYNLSALLHRAKIPSMVRRLVKIPGIPNTGLCKWGYEEGSKGDTAICIPLIFNVVRFRSLVWHHRLVHHRTHHWTVLQALLLQSHMTAALGSALRTAEISATESSETDAIWMFSSSPYMLRYCGKKLQASAIWTSPGYRWMTFRRDRLRQNHHRTPQLRTGQGLEGLSGLRIRSILDTVSYTAHVTRILSL